MTASSTKDGDGSEGDAGSQSHQIVSLHSYNRNVSVRDADQHKQLSIYLIKTQPYLNSEGTESPSTGTKTFLLQAD